MSTLCNCHGIIFLDCPNYRSTRQGKPISLAKQLIAEWGLTPGLNQEDLENKVAKLLERERALAEEPWRKLLWSNHARYLPFQHTPYGDDGEMQCCGIDFKRTPVAEIDKLLVERSLRQIQLERAAKQGELAWCWAMKEYVPAGSFCSQCGEHLVGGNEYSDPNEQA